MADVSAVVASLQPELWTASLNEAITVFITDTEGSALSFQPAFTYPIFGEAETVFGYRDLQIFLCFDSVTFLPFLNVKYGEKLPDAEFDLEQKMMEFLPKSTIFKDEAKWRDAIDAEQVNFLIPGEMFGDTWTKNGNEYAIYRIDMASARGDELLSRLQILVLLFIEAGTFIEHDDPLWDVYVMYKVTNKNLPEIVGFTTAYNYWRYPGAEKFDAGVVETRKKISQFIVLPIFQGQSLGGDMYTRLYSEWLKDPRIVEIVVEDPNESFDDLRDRSDLTRLVNLGAIDLSTFLLASAKEPGFFDTFKAAQKLEKRQLQRLLEMVLLHQLRAGSSSDTKRDVRLFVKKRLLEKNAEALAGMDEPTRLDKLQTAYEALEEDYFRILEPVKIAAKRSPAANLPQAKRAKKE